MTVVVAGGTGLMGRRVVERLQDRGLEAVVVARSTGVDLSTGEGLEAAMSGADAVIDVSNVSTISRARAVHFFGRSTGHLLRAAQQAGVAHLLALSVVGADRIDHGYYLGKRRQQELVAAGPVPWTLLRSTQFHEFAGQVVAMGRGPVVPCPARLCRPVSAGEVADHLLELLDAGPGGIVVPISGPTTMPLSSMVRRYLAAHRLRRLLVPVPFPGDVGRAMRSGGLVPDDGVRGTVTFDRYLAEPGGT